METLDVPPRTASRGREIWLKPPEEGQGRIRRARPAPGAQRLGPENRPAHWLSRRGLEQPHRFPQVDQSQPQIQAAGDGKIPGACKCSSATQTIRQALASICAMYDLHYQIDADNTIILLGAPQATGDFARKTYWLTPDAFAKDAIAQDVLAAKGITFGEGHFRGLAAGVRRAYDDQLAGKIRTSWRRCSRPILVAARVPPRSVAAAHQRGPAGAGGGQIRPRFHHWRAIIPFTAPSRFRWRRSTASATSAPESTATTRSLENWLAARQRPGAGNTPRRAAKGSPLLGKAATTFKLPLLGGGDFDLDAVKGQVIVLDFWATWCAPCVQYPARIDRDPRFVSG